MLEVVSHGNSKGTGLFECVAGRPLPSPTAIISFPSIGRLLTSRRSKQSMPALQVLGTLLQPFKAGGPHSKDMERFLVHLGREKRTIRRSVLAQTFAAGQAGRQAWFAREVRVAELVQKPHLGCTCTSMEGVGPTTAHLRRRVDALHEQSTSHISYSVQGGSKPEKSQVPGSGTRSRSVASTKSHSSR